MNSSQPVPSLLCLGSLVSSPNTLPSVWGGSRAGGSWLVSGYFLEEEGKESGQAEDNLRSFVYRDDG